MDRIYFKPTTRIEGNFFDHTANEYWEDKISDCGFLGCQDHRWQRRVDGIVICEVVSFSELLIILHGSDCLNQWKWNTVSDWPVDVVCLVAFGLAADQ